jgi:hypothetical protein
LDLEIFYLLQLADQGRLPARSKDFLISLVVRNTFMVRRSSGSIGCKIFVVAALFGALFAMSAVTASAQTPTPTPTPNPAPEPTPTPEPQPGLPTQLELTTEITVGGLFTAIVEFRDDADELVRINRRDRCRVEFFANITEGGTEEVDPTEISVTASTRRIGRIGIRKGRPNRAQYAARRLRRVIDQGDTVDDARMNAQARLVCGRGQNRVIINSNPSARFIICGRNQPADAPNRFLRRVSEQGSTSTSRTPV